MTGSPPSGGRADDAMPADDPDDDARTLHALAALLGSPALWDDAPPRADAVVDAIAAEAVTRPMDRGPVSDDPRFRHRLILRVAAAVIVVAAAVGVVAGVRDSDDGTDVASGDAGAGGDAIEVALAGTDLAPEASAVAAFEETPVGLRILLDVTGLAPAPEGSYYEAWIGRPGADPESRVCAGSFHLRGGDGTVVLWAGVGWADQGEITIALRDAGAPAVGGAGGSVVLTSS